MKKQFVKFLEDKGVLEQYLEYIQHNDPYFIKTKTLNDVFEAFPEEKGEAIEWVINTFDFHNPFVRENQTFWMHIHEDWCGLIKKSWK